MTIYWVLLQYFPYVIVFIHPTSLTLGILVNITVETKTLKCKDLNSKPVVLNH